MRNYFLEVFYGQVLLNFHWTVAVGPKIFNAAQPGVGHVQVLGSKKQTEEEEEQFFGHCMTDKHDSA